ncbi:universal stress protein [Nocardioides sp. C4-1]|uniref:universal stress protein n=1 Tax=Nocardioides sp. C4-1 TaxID=3151851 RepID=UPI003262DF85
MSVVLGYDESPGARHALTVAISVATRYAEPLVLVHGSTPPGGLGEESAVHRAALEEQGRAALAHAVEEAEAAGVETVLEHVSARPVDALLEVAERHDAAVIVVGTWGESPLRGAILGSTPHKLLHLSTRPVLCVPPPSPAD